ncbi:endonuclease [Clostridia bacterium]|nr:endonuclease [Clostridia bacterium]
MPNRPPTPCAKQGCPELTRDRYCPAHAKEDARNYERYRRDPATAKRYGGVWRKIRLVYLADHPLCEDCEKQGRLTPAEEVHHIKPLTDDPSRAGSGTHDFSNLRALCTSCHSAITARAHIARK